jgi:hypothetical protein
MSAKMELFDLQVLARNNPKLHGKALAEYEQRIRESREPIEVMESPRKATKPVTKCLTKGRESQPNDDDFELFIQERAREVQQLAETGPAPKPRTQRRHPEADLQADIVKALRLCGYTVLSTVHIYKRVQCSKCGEWVMPRSGYGATKGIGDLLVARADGYWLMADIKAPKGRLSLEQRELVKQRRLQIWRSVNEAIEGVKGL